ncbi:MAG: hypothetical protein HUK40_13975 [Desulfobacter sp.]|nr:hypothetical protein [Desulfobacter sp.]WDP87742.1 MAG: hypothetical protein HUN05_23550 [Desulfobacter sp.]
MNKRLKPIFLLAVLSLGLCLTASAAWAQGNTPESAVKGFAKAYYMLDASMADFLSVDARVNENDVDMVGLYLRVKEQNAKNRGYQMSYLKMHPILMKTQVLEITEDKAVVKLQTTALRSINPLYRIVGYIFGLIQEHEFETTYTLVKEEGAWKLGPGAFNVMI